MLAGRRSEREQWTQSDAGWAFQGGRNGRAGSLVPKGRNRFIPAHQSRKLKGLGLGHRNMAIAVRVNTMLVRRRIVRTKIIMLMEFHVQRCACMLFVRVAQGFRTGRQCQKGDCSQQGHQPLQEEMHDLHHISRLA